MASSLVHTPSSTPGFVKNPSSASLLSLTIQPNNQQAGKHNLFGAGSWDIGSKCYKVHILM